MKYQEIKASKEDSSKKGTKNEWMGIHDPFKVSTTNNKNSLIYLKTNNY